MIKRTEMEVQTLYDRLHNESAVAKKLGVSRHALYDYRVRHNIHYDPVQAKVKTYNAVYADRNNQIVNAYLSDVPMEQICSNFNMNKPAINYILLKYKVKRPAVKSPLVDERNANILNGLRN